MSSKRQFIDLTFEDKDEKYEYDCEKKPKYEEEKKIENNKNLNIQQIVSICANQVLQCRIESVSFDFASVLRMLLYSFLVECTKNGVIDIGDDGTWNFKIDFKKEFLFKK